MQQLHNEYDPKRNHFILFKLFLQGDFSALDVGSTMIFASLLTLALFGRCINLEDVFGILAAFVGVALVTQPQFLFGSVMKQVKTPAPAYA